MSTRPVGEIVLVIHWKGGQHSELRVRKPRTGEHGCHTPEEALAVIGSMAGRWSDQDIAALSEPNGNADWFLQRANGSSRGDVEYLLARDKCSQ